MRTLSRKFYSWLAERSHAISMWAVRRAYRKIHQHAGEVSRYGAEAYQQIADEFAEEWMKHDSTGLCRKYGIQQEHYYRKLAENFGKN